MYQNTLELSGQETSIQELRACIAQILYLNTLAKRFAPARQVKHLADLKAWTLGLCRMIDSVDTVNHLNSSNRNGLNL